MNYTDIEIEGMKELLKENELEIGRLRKEIKNLKAELEKEDKAKMDALNGMSDLSIFGLEQIKKLEQENKNLREQLIQRNIQNDNLGIKNKKLIEENNILKNELMEDMKYETKLEKENKKLKSEIRRITNQRDNLSGIANNLVDENRYLEEENAELKSELSKFRDSFKKYRDYEKEELAESCYDLARENEKLKEEIGKLVMKH